MAAPLDGHSSEVGITSRNARPVFLVRGLGPADAENVGTFSRAQTRAILIVAVTAASISLGVAIVSLRWFLSMKRSFRHHLILMLILSDSFKALWYFISPIMIFSCTSWATLRARRHSPKQAAFSLPPESRLQTFQSYSLLCTRHFTSSAIRRDWVMEISTATGIWSTACGLVCRFLLPRLHSPTLQATHISRLGRSRTFPSDPSGIDLHWRGYLATS